MKDPALLALDSLSPPSPYQRGYRDAVKLMLEALREEAERVRWESDETAQDILRAADFIEERFNEGH